MTRKDFELIARVVLAQRRDNLFLTPDDADAMARAFADELRATNKQFNRDKFLRACGVQSL